MAKKSPRHPVRYEKDKSGCMWGFISMFDLRQGRTTRKLIADKRRGSKHDIGGEHSKNRFDMLRNLSEDCQDNLENGDSKRLTVTTVANKPSVKKLIEEEMFIDHDSMKGMGDAEVVAEKPRLGHEDSQRIDSKRKKKSRKKSPDMDTHDLNSDTTLKSELSHNQHSRQQSKNNLDLDKIMEDLCHLKSACSVMHDNDGEVHAQSNQKNVVAENNAKYAFHEFVNQMIFDVEDLPEARKILCSHELMEALQILSSDKELFLKLLQDPNSLFLKYVKELADAQGSNDKEHSSITGSNLSEHEAGNPRQTREIVNHKQRNFFRKKVKSQAKNSRNGDEDTDSSNRIVILKTGPMSLQNSETENNLASSLDAHDIVRCKDPSVRVGSHFSLTEIKKKLKHAMGKDRHGNPERISKRLTAESQNKGQGSKVIVKDNVGMKSPTKDHFFIEKIARPTFDVTKGDKAVICKDCEVTVEHGNSSYPKQRVSNLYIEAKKHLCEVLGDGDENMDFSNRQIPKTLGRILSLPEYNFSPLGSPGRDWEHHFVTAQTRFSATEKIQEANEHVLSPKQATFVSDLDQAASNAEKRSSICDEISDKKVQEVNSKPKSSDDLINDDKVGTTFFPVIDEIIPDGNAESAKEMHVLDSSSETVDLTAGKDQNCCISEISDVATHLQCLNQDVSNENQPPSSPPLSPSHSSITKRIEELEGVTDVSARPSPVSVLDTPFLEDDISPGNTKVQPVKVPVQPLQIQFEEHDSSPLDPIDREKHCVEENKLIFNYIKAVLRASGLNSDQLWKQCLSSNQILDPSLLDQVEFLSNQLCHDQKLLFDCVNEVLMEVCWHYFGVAPWLSFVNPSIRPLPNMEKVILKVWEGVCWQFLPLPPPHTLEQIVRKDMTRGGAWMDLRFDAETVGAEMGDAILAELMEDTILSFVSESPETKFSQLPFDSKDKDSNTS